MTLNRLGVAFMLGRWEYYVPGAYSRRARFAPFHTRFLNEKAHVEVRHAFGAWYCPEYERWGVNLDTRKVKRLPRWSDVVFPIRVVGHEERGFYVDDLIDWSGAFRVAPDTSEKGSRFGLFMFDVALPVLPDADARWASESNNLKSTLYAVKLPDGANQLRMWGVCIIDRVRTMEIEIPGATGDVFKISMHWGRVHGEIRTQVNDHVIESLVYDKEFRNKLQTRKERRF